MCSSAPAPDPAIGQAALGNLEISKEMLAYYREKDAESKPARDAAISLALDQAKVQTETARKQNAMADETYDYTKKTFRPLEQKIASDAIGYDTTARRDSEAAQAQADIGTAGDAARISLARDVVSRGGDVNSGNFTASLANASVREAAAKAAAGNQARKNVETVGAAKVADAAALGRGIASTNATQTQLGLQAGNSAVSTSQVPGNVTAQQVSGMNQTGSAAAGVNSSAGNLLLGQYSAQNAAGSNDAAVGALGQLGGAAIASKSLFGFSDKRLKKDRKNVRPEVSLAAVRKMPVQSWKYKKGTVADDGGKTHIGPMAQSVKAALGDATAPGGKVVDFISLAGHTLAAVQALDKKVSKISLAGARRRKR